MEPRSRHLRPIPMMRILARCVAFAALVLVAGCGSASTSSTTGKDPAKAATTSKVGECDVDSPAVVGARTIARLDLSADGRADALKLTAPGGDCPDLMFAKLGQGYAAAQLPSGEPAPSEAFGVTVPGRDGGLLVTRQNHPRGGFQLRVYAVADDALTELKVDGHSLVPFVATDVPEHPLSVDCGDGGVVLTEATAHQPSGVAFAWDVTRTSYAVKGSVVTAGKPQKIEDNVLPGRLRAKYPELLQHTAFATCRAS